MSNLAKFDENRVKLRKIWTLFVGGGEVNDYYLTYKQANKLMQEYIDDGYTDCEIVRCEV